MKKINALVVLGNGFDLSLGLKSTYRDFLISLNLSHNHISDEDSIWPFIIRENLNISDISWQDIEFSIMNFIHNVDNNVLNLKNTIEIVHNYEVTNKKFGRLIKSDFDLSEFQINLLLRIGNYIGVSDCVIDSLINRSAGIRLGEIYINLISEVKKLENQFSNYMLNLLGKFDYQTKALKRFEKLLSINNTKSLFDFNDIFILNFNYTRILEKSLYESNLFRYKAIERNIHGSLSFEENIDQNIIFGIDSEEISIQESPELYQLTKTYRVMNNNIKSIVETPKSIPKDLDYIYFYGHSLGKQDYSYFQSIFDSIDLYYSKTILRFIYSDYFSSNKEYEKELINTRVAQLLEVYGQSFQQESKRGKNLLHKLLVENRLEIILLNP